MDETRAAVDNSAWDGQMAMSGCANSADPAAAYRAICAGRREGDPAIQATWALPHHSHPGDAPNADGVRNSLSRLPQTQGLINRDAAQRHLDAHMADIQAAAKRSVGQSVETRELADAALEFRSEDDGLHSSGYPAVFGVESQPIGGRFVEILEPPVFRHSLADGGNIKLNVDHNDEKLLASTASGALRLATDERGLKHEARHAATSWALDLATLAKAKEIRSMSFSFKVPRGGEKWSDGGQRRTLSEVKLISIAILTGKPPAYPQASAYVRSLAETLDVQLDDLTIAIAALSEGRALSDAEVNLIERATDATRENPKVASVPISIAEKRAALDALEASFRNRPESPSRTG